ncbi:hypothetical protein Tco_0573009 [Tanacetum coccineum]
MDDPNITMKEYIRLEEEKAQRHVLSEPTVCPPNENEVDFRISLDGSDDEDYTVIFDENSFSYKIISVNDLKTDSGNDKPLSPNPTVDYFDDLDYFKDFKNEFPTIIYNGGLTSKSDVEIKSLVSSERIDEFNLIDEASLSEYDEEIVSCFNDLFNIIPPDDSKSEKDNDDNDIDMAPLPTVDQRHPWLKYQIEEYNEGIRHSYEQRLETIWSKLVNRVHVLDFKGLNLEMRPDLAVRLRIKILAKAAVFPVDDRDGALLDVLYAYTLCFLVGSMDCWTTNDPYLLAQYLFRHAEGRKNGARLSEGHFIRHLAMHFRLVSDEGLRGLHVVTRELLLIDLHELGRLHICTRYGDTWAWVAQGPERQQTATASAHKAD